MEEKFEEKYIKKIIKQYKKAKGIEKFDMYDAKDMRALSDYIGEMSSHVDDYIKLLHTLDVHLDDERTVEVGKGPFDSVVAKKRATIVSLYAALFDERNGLIFGGYPVVSNGDIALSYVKDSTDNVEELDIAKGRLYMTHNMYSHKEANDWFELTKNNQVLIGVFGDESDKDREDKIQAVRARFDEIGAAYSNYGVRDHYYFYAMKSKKLVK